MARGGGVKGIRIKAPLQENAKRIIAFRLAELLSWRHATADASAVADLHNLRIAAKRLRYALEIFERCFPSVKPMLQKLTDLQESVGDIHDLDVLVAIIRDRLRHVDGDIETLAVNIMQSSATSAERSNQLRQLLYAQARDRQRLGLIGLLGDYIAARETHYAKFQKHWGGVAMDSFEADLLDAIDMSHDAKAKETDGHPGADTDHAVEGALSGG